MNSNSGETSSDPGNLGHQTIQNMTLAKTGDEVREKREKSVTIFDDPNPNLHIHSSTVPEDAGIKYVAEKPHQSQTKEDESGLANVTYTKLESVVAMDAPENPESYGPGRDSIMYPIEDSIYEALLVFFICAYNLFFSLIIAYWHYEEGKSTEANQTLAILFVNAITIQLVFAFNRNIKKANIWNESKIFSILSVIPGTLTILLSFADFVFAIQEARSRIYTRPWANTRMVYVVESLLLVLPQCVLQSVLLVQDPESIPKIKGLFVLFSMGLMTMGIALARIRYDTTRRPERFGTGIDKIIRSTIVWGNKGLWVTTYTLLVVTVQLLYPGNNTAVVLGILALFVLYEVPIMLSSMYVLRKLIGRISGMFFVLPQFVSLFVLVLWTNADSTVYTTNVGICALGAFSWFESVAIIGWLLDGCSDREMDILPLYPHFLGDFYSRCCRSGPEPHHH